MLDTFPYSGATTTIESLWMGVPVVTRTGDRYASRMSASMLRAAGLEELASHDEAGFVRAALGLAEDGRRLVGLRAGLRGALAGTSFCRPAEVADSLAKILLTSPATALAA
jgi:protein O-GlcNAc transferase